MKKLIFSALLIGGACFSMAAEGTSAAPDGYILRWSDEFDGNTLNEKIWNIEVNGNGGGNQELQYYRRENVSVGVDPKTGENCLILTARRENYSGKPFTSGRISSNNKAAFKHGMLQARIKFPKTTNGLWPAYWMMGNDYSKVGWPRCGEMDIVELGHSNGIKAGTQDRYFGGTLHYGPSARNEDHQQIPQEYTAPEDQPITDGEYHIITVEWDENNLYMYYDMPGYTAANKRNSRYFSLEIPASDNDFSVGKYFHKPFFFIFNLAVGGTFPGIYDANGITALPNAGDEAKMYVDWVRVYQKEGDDENYQYTYVDENGNTVTNIEEEPDVPAQPDTKTELSSFASKALDENGETTFDFNDVSDAVLISTSDGVRGHLLSADVNVIDYNVNNTNRNLWIWENTYVPVNRDGQINSFGWEEGYNKFTVGSVGWSGLGFDIQHEDLSMIDNTWWLHFAMRATDVELHTSHEMSVGKAKFKVGASDGKVASIGDFRRDGEWYYFDIPVAALEQFYSPMVGLKADYADNIITFVSGGITDAELCFDNIFFYKSKSKEIPVFTDTKSNLGKYGYASLDEDGNAVFTFDDVTEVVPLFLSGDTWESLTAGGTYENSIIKEEWDNSEQGGRNNFFVWGDPQTMKVGNVADTPNSFGRTPYGGFPSYSSETDGISWNGAGWASIAGQGVNPMPKDLSMIDDEWYVHFSVRSDAAVSHIPVMIRFGSTDADATIVLGSYSTKTMFADFNRDGNWYSFDIPVVELKKYGQLWSNAPSKGGINAYTDYALCIYTDQTFYNNSFFSIDNVFFYRKAEAPEVNELGDYTTKSLDENGETYFDFKGKHFINITANGDVTERMKVESEDDILLDIRPSVNGCNYYVWDGTYVSQPMPDGVPNSFGGDEGWQYFTVGGSGWSGAGSIVDKGVDLSMLEDGNWHLHFAMRGTDDAVHYISLGNAAFTIGATPYMDNGKAITILGNYKRDGEWYSFDIPYEVLSNMVTEVFPASKGGIGSYRDNFFWYMSGGKTGHELHLDNVFLWRDKDSVPGSGVDEITDAEEVEYPVEIFNLNGLRCNSMDAPGLYIVRQGSKVRKVIVR